MRFQTLTIPSNRDQHVLQAHEIARFVVNESPIASPEECDAEMAAFELNTDGATC